MNRSCRIAILALLLGGLMFAVWNNRARPRIGMTDEPCTAEGKAVAANPKGDWAQLCHYRSENARLLARGIRPDAVFIGDSLTEQWPMFEPEMFGERLVNRGIIGQTSGQALLRFHRDVVALRPRIAHIMIGVNDVAGNAGPNSPDELRSNIRAMTEIAQANGIVVVLGTIPPPYDFRPLADIPPDKWVPSINRWIESFAGERGLVLADYRRAVVTPDGKFILDRYRDGMHPGEQGYAAMRPLLDRALAEAMAKPGAGS